MTGEAGTKSNWSDLGTRVVSAIIMIAIGAAGLFAGGVWFQLLVALLCGAMVWELARMLNTGKPGFAIGMGTVSALAVYLSVLVPLLTFPLLLAPGLVAWSTLARWRKMFVMYCTGILFAGFGLIALRLTDGVLWALWLIVVVVIVDVAGYFAGRFLGGPKFWPAIIPKKTWSGTVAGWLGAALFGLAASSALPMGAGGLAVLSVLVAVASQMGDIAESAIKRRVGVKDSSQLIPGHGGLLDRFDGMMGAALLLFLVGKVMVLSPIAG